MHTRTAAILQLVVDAGDVVEDVSHSSRGRLREVRAGTEACTTSRITVDDECMGKYTGACGCANGGWRMRDHASDHKRGSNWHTVDDGRVHSQAEVNNRIRGVR